jgi:hypothetical protein
MQTSGQAVARLHISTEGGSSDARHGDHPVQQQQQQQQQQQ